MAYDYDKLYRTTPNALGAASAMVVDFFDKYTKVKARVLDLGCGQGRDALAIARLGHTVLGVDVSPAGINDLLVGARSEGLSVSGEVADICVYTPSGVFDVIVFDRTLHMLERNSRLGVFGRMIECLANGGHILISDEKPNLSGFQKLLENDKRDWVVAVKKSTLLAHENSGD